MGRKSKIETRIKQYNKIKSNSKSKKKSIKRRKIRHSKGDKENVHSMINIKTQIRDMPNTQFNNISFAYDSIDVFKSKPHTEEVNDSSAKISTSKFPLNDQSGGDQCNHSALLKQRMKVRKISLCVDKAMLNKRNHKKSHLNSGGKHSSHKNTRKSPKIKSGKKAKSRDINKS